MALSITHFGPYPPTYGGVSVHIRRLHLRLLRLGWKSSVVSPPNLQAFPEPGVTEARHFRRRSHWLRYPGIPIPGEVIHCHDCWMRMSWVLCRLRLQGRAVVVTVHDQQDPRRWKAAGIDRRLGARFLARLPNVRWIAVSETVRGQLLARGICAKRIAVIPAFLAPAKEDSGPVALPRSLQDFLAAHEPVLSIYGSKYDFVDGLDLYGFDMAIEALASLKLDFPRSGLVVCVPGDFRREYQDQLRERAIRLGCLGEVLFLEEGLPDGSELWRRSSVHLRPTVTDGDSVAVREALGLGVAVVASDAVARPQGCILFPNRNLDSFVDGIKSALASPPQLRYDGDERSATHFRAILGEYQRAAGKSSVPEFQNSDE